MSGETGDYAHDAGYWKAEARGLGYMILDIARSFENLGDTELFRGRLFSARDYVDGPLRAVMEGST